jgi:hypothetical protein
MERSASANASSKGASCAGGVGTQFERHGELREVRRDCEPRDTRVWVIRGQLLGGGVETF